MFGAFKPSAQLSGGLLWKIPWRLSPPQKLRHRRRMRRVDNIVSVLDTALKRQAATSSAAARSSAGEASPPSASSESPATASLKPSHPGLLTATPSTTTIQNARTASTRTPPSPTSQQIPRTSDTIKLIERWKAEMPTEAEMLPRDKYSMFDRKARGYRKGVHKLPKWTRVSQRLNPPGF
ncbi:hypothetical protein LTR02_012565 [Friedmanniomyces endolithicus]|nr:hypothetical protein LTS09_002152 [Friedmanniomyces endolithicus]KAK0353646.1 hypothetical protein LTR94_015784 [Friedmanniomyces endolithicus]KAK0785449.1 hypothetical protein LTR59_011016 [Friedmanniomyces endolithicus]KAK0811363.1 hypothetical protein LTR38_003691 [Friedmanniomyces endolithicus]KAK0836760.1 hypothetical protein LTR03_013388 [Friedmanniomyces endolithicus]